jgi:iron complex transport system substrate-binding protein
MSKRLISIVALSLLSAPAWGMRIVSLLPSNTEILQSLGAAQEVVGVTRFDRLAAQPGVKNVGDFSQPSMESIVALHPDLILAGLWTSSHVVPRLKSMGYKVLEVRNEKSFDDIYESIRILANAVGHPAAADPVINDMKKRRGEVQRRARALPRRLKTYIEIDRPYWTIGGHDFLGEALGDAGADNVFADLKRQAAQVAPELILQRNPELIISFVDKAPQVKARAGWGTIRAIREGYIIDDLVEDDISRPSPHLLIGMEALISRIERLEKK